MIMKKYDNFSKFLLEVIIKKIIINTIINPIIISSQEGIKLANNPNDTP